MWTYDEMKRASETVLHKGVYKVYYNKGQIMVKKGNIMANYVFWPDGAKTWQTGLKRGCKPLELSGQSVWCKTKEDIPKAIEILTERHMKYIKEVEERTQRMKDQFIEVVGYDYEV